MWKTTIFVAKHAASAVADVAWLFVASLTGRELRPFSKFIDYRLSPCPLLS